ncbi:putative circadian clock protein, KaiC [Ignisphaera aggregans DSM 17230]|uniref:Putative circadian clock protein, KaiC n=1 Tax=Ignisphaera aggregans (strain DSM 17230 / JCM 13409 / AQ1.S1) TaxID=583356 RepID=E0SSD2_IGNAA|nr:putative circadian clock protein, KaiC [Ignisphaera aggregans DSM 17230]
MSEVRSYVFGEEALDAFLAGGIEPGSLILVLGHPGAGKSTFVARMIYENIMRYNVKGLYIGFAETKEKFYSYMKRFGIDFNLAEEKGLFTFIQMPTMSGKDLLEGVTSVLSEKIFSEGYSIAVVDSITLILNVLTTDEARAYLHASLYSLTSTAKILLILIADLPFATETVDLKGLEFIADAVIVFKTRIEKGLIHRFMEIRKFRGKPIPMAEIPFAIEDGRGIRVLLSPAILQTPYTPPITGYKDICTDGVWGELHTTSYIGIVSECRTKPLSILSLLARVIHAYGLTYGVISFKETPEIIKTAISEAAKAIHSPPHYILNKAMFIQNVNPAAYSTQQIDAILRNYIEQNINILILFDVDALYLYHDPHMVDRILGFLAMYAKSGSTIVFEFIDNVYTDTQLMRYDIIHRIRCEGTKIIHGVVHSRTLGIDIKGSRAITEIGDAEVVECIEKNPVGQL